MTLRHAGVKDRIFGGSMFQVIVAVRRRAPAPAPRAHLCPEIPKPSIAIRTSRRARSGSPGRIGASLRAAIEAAAEDELSEEVLSGALDEA